MYKKLFVISIISILLFTQNSYATDSFNSKETMNTNLILNELKSIDYNNEDELQNLFKKNFEKQFSNNAIIKSDLEVVNYEFSKEGIYILDETTKIDFQNVNGLGIATVIKNNPLQEMTTSSISRTGTEDFNAYSIVGNVLFKVSIKYDFSVSSNYVSVREGKGFISPGFLSMWTGNIWTDKSNGQSRASVNSYGTASWSIPIANIIGINVNVQSINYDAFVYCSNRGSVTSNISYRQN